MITLTATATSLKQAKALLAAGADRLYIGNQHFGLRLPASFSVEEIKEINALAQAEQKQVIVAVTGIMHPAKMEEVLPYLKSLVEAGIEEIEVGDVGVIQLLRKENLPLRYVYNAQMLVTNSRQINFWAQRGAVRAVLGREVPYVEMAELFQEVKIPVEVLVYGATCIHQSLRPLLTNYKNYIGVEVATNKEANLFLAEPRKGGSHYSIYEDEHGTHIFADNDLNLMPELQNLVQIGATEWKLDGLYTDETAFVEIVRLFAQARQALTEGSWNEALSYRLSNQIRDLHPKERGLDEGFYHYSADEVK